MKPTMKFISEDGEMYIMGEVTQPTKMPELGVSAQLMYGRMELVIQSKGCLMLTDDGFVAKVRLERPDLLNDARDFREAETALLDQLRIDQVYHDGVTAIRDKCREKFLAQLEHVIKQWDLSEENGNTRFELAKFIERIKHGLSYVDLCREVMSNPSQYDGLQEYAKELENEEQKSSFREKLFRRFMLNVEDQTKHLMDRLNNFLREIVEPQRNELLMNAPAFLHGSLLNISLEHLMLIRSTDVKLFTDMSNVLRADIFRKPLEDLANHWIRRVKSITIDGVKESPQLTSVIYFFLCKSLEEVIVEITERTGHRATDLLKSDHQGWYPVKVIIWKSRNECLQREYDFIFRVLKHFKAAFNFGRQPFQYEMQRFNNGQGILNGLVRNGVPDEFYVWLCLLDDVLFHILPKGCELSMFDDVFKTYVQMIHDAKKDQMETLRVVTHSLTRFIIEFCSYGGKSPLDMEILRKQLDFFSLKTNPSVNSSKNFRDQVNVFNSFWKTKKDIIDRFPMKISLPEMCLIQERLMKIMMAVLDKDVDVETRVGFFRAYNDFVNDLNAISFKWYIKAIPKVDMKSVINLGKVELIENKWKESKNRCYEVLDPEKFTAYITTLIKKSDIPRHYIIEVIKTLLEHISSQLQRSSWKTGESLSDRDQVLSTNEFIIAIGKSLLYLKEQIDYVSYDQFCNERVGPFSSVLESATSRQDFSNRIHLIKESFWYIRKQNEISLEEALQLYDELNNSHDADLLRKSHKKYSKFFEEFMQLSTDKDCSKRASLVARKIKTQFTGNVPFKTWDNRFKQEQVPQILAGLAAVWSILVSKDVVNVGKYFNPHCIQVLCVLRLLSVDKAEQGIDKHLAQVLTGQGKSLILGLLAALLALTGHRVRIACYSAYLAKRDEQNFLTFYEMFNVTEDVIYGTFDDLAKEIISPKVGRETITLSGLVSDLLYKEKEILPHSLVSADSSNNILLMDEVDVFFTKEFYGNSYNPSCLLRIPGLDRIQEQIWKYVVSSVADVEGRIETFIRSDEFEQREGFLKFLERPNSYVMLTDGASQKRTFTNRTLFDEHVKLMIKYAKNVYSEPTKWGDFKLNSAGVITCKKRGIYVFSYMYGYENVFNYFRLKKEQFVADVDEQDNYGYIIIECGSLSYAMLPKNYPLIVGVTGTLESLNHYEKKTIEELYNIKKTSLMPTFFGDSNLKFNEVDNFHHYTAKSSWRTNIFSQANKMIAVNRAVIIFFDTDVELNAFEAEYAGKIDRLNVLTENTDDTERLISEAGVTKTITLATRGMGRGVDYKSSVTVEKNGGVHVIQTFFSMDVKEEIQIKGRTARKDNLGSYELIVCDEDLVPKGLMPDWNFIAFNNGSFKLNTDLLKNNKMPKRYNITYAELDAKRREVSLKQNAKLSTKIKDGLDAHEKTMDYMRSFFKK